MMKDRSSVRSMLKQLLQVISVATVSEDEIIHALEIEWDDFEDSVQYSVALLGSMDGVVTRNQNDFDGSELPVWTPEEIIQYAEAMD